MIMNCQVSGLSKEDKDRKEMILDIIKRKCERIEPIAKITELKANFKRHNTSPSKVKYSVKLHMFSDIGTFVSEAHDWEIFKALRDGLKKLETEIKRKKNKLVD